MPAKNTKLDRSSKSPFTKAVKNIHGLIKKGQVKVEKPQVKSRPRVPSTKVANQEPVVRARDDRGVVYLSHLPNGFEENGIQGYLQQFGEVTGIKLVRSKRTGRSQGFAFVEFKSRDVAEVVAKTMNNYLMLDRLVKAKLLEREERTRFAPLDTPIADPEKCPTAKHRRSYLQKRDRKKSDKEEQQALARTYKSVRKLTRKLAEKGISFKLARHPIEKTLKPRRCFDKRNDSAEPALGSNEPKLDHKQKALMPARGRRSRRARQPAVDSSESEVDSA